MLATYVWSRQILQLLTVCYRACFLCLVVSHWRRFIRDQTIMTKILEAYAIESCVDRFKGGKMLSISVPSIMALEMRRSNDSFSDVNSDSSIGYNGLF